MENRKKHEHNSVIFGQGTEQTWFHISAYDLSSFDRHDNEIVLFCLFTKF